MEVKSKGRKREEGCEVKMAFGGCCHQNKEELNPYLELCFLLDSEETRPAQR
jgi:hypothetical protein